MTTSSDLPHIPKDLLDALDEKYPERCPDPRWTEREVWMRVGERAVIRHLKRLFEEQNSNVLSTKVIDQ